MFIAQCLDVFGRSFRSDMLGTTVMALLAERSVVSSVRSIKILLLRSKDTSAKYVTAQIKEWSKCFHEESSVLCA